MTDKPPLYLIDASGFIFRAYFALPPLTAPDGTPVGAVLGFINMMLRLSQEQRMDHCAVIFDAARLTFRNELYPAYKAHRPPAPEDLVPQFALVRDATRAFGLEVIESEGFEADDLIASYARAAVESGQRVIVVSSDKDLMQLMRDGVELYDPIKSRTLTLDDVHAKFGVAPNKVIEVQSLIGDPTDNVPGVPGIGPKTAAELILEYGSLDALLTQVDRVKQPKRREALIENADKARVSYQLVRLKDDVALPVPLSACHAPDLRGSLLRDFVVRYNFRSVLNRLSNTIDQKQDIVIADAPEAAAVPFEYATVLTLDQLAPYLARARETGLIALDTETTGLTPAKEELVGVSIAVDGLPAAYLPLRHRGSDDLLDPAGGAAVQNFNAAEFFDAVQDVLTDPSILKIGHNLKYDLQFFDAAGIRVAPVTDTMLISYALDSGAHGHGLDELAKLHLGHSMISFESVAGSGRNQKRFDTIPVQAASEYAAEDAWATLRLYQVLHPRLASENKVALYERIERPLIRVIADMERTGIAIDTEALQILSHNFGLKLAALEKTIHDTAGHPFNIASPKQLGQVLFEELGLQGGKKTKTGDWSTNAEVLEGLSEAGAPLVDDVLEWRGLAKLKSTYSDALLTDINPKTRRVHTSYSLAATSTGRLASSNPNLQNIPVRTDDGKLIRAAFVAKNGYELLSVDYSQIELRLVAAMADIRALKQAFQDKVDIHALTASEVFGVPLSQMTPALRRQAKAINFGIIYGISAFGLGKQLGIGAGEASTYIKAYFARFPELSAYMEAKKEEARTAGYVRTLFGRTCTIDGIKDKNPARRAFAERQAINAPIQGTAADIIKLAMADVAALLAARPDLDCTMLLQVHDELVFEVRADQVDEAARVIVDTMERVADIGVPLTAEAGKGKTWADAH